ncbi:MAG TPA: MmcQ/YjbR family DNA-binding protein [Flavisolibacter sp.]|nr:MmcQ/YjbR family DNA-binding protein [Flavisolibacter sp.]
MVTIETFKTLALSFPETVELPHFDLTSFRVKKKIFATLSEEKQRAMLKLSLLDQSVFCSFDKTVIYPVPGAWGKKGCTYFELKKIKKQMLNDALTQAYSAVAPKTLVEKMKLMNG